MEKNIVNFSSAPGGRARDMKEVIKIALETAVGIRRSLSRNGIRQIADFVNGMSLAGILVEKNFRTEDPSMDFASTFKDKVEAVAREFTDDAYSGYRDAMRKHDFGVQDQSPTEMLVTAGLSAQSVVTTVAEDYDLTRQQALDVVTMVIALAIVASTQPADLDFVIKSMIENITEKATEWSAMIPTDEELFGDEDF